MRLSRPALIGYVILVVLIAMAFWAQSRLAANLEKEGIIRAYNLCISNNETREVLRVTIQDARNTIIERQAEGRLTSEEENRINETIAYYDRAIARLQPKNCPPPPPDLPIQQRTPLDAPSRTSTIE